VGVRRQRYSITAKCGIFPTKQAVKSREKSMNKNEIANCTNHVCRIIYLIIRSEPRLSIYMGMKGKEKSSILYGGERA
jgi:hypothetical protein